MIDRRCALIYGSRFVGLAVASGLHGCSSIETLDPSLPQSCEGIPDPIDRSLCRQQYLRNTTVQYVTLGMLIGAALGAASAPLLKINPFVGAAIGGALLGGAAAVDRYINYRLEQANGDMNRALADVKRDVTTDVQRGIIIRDDLKASLDATRIELSATKRSLLKQSQQIEKIHAVVREASLNSETYNHTVNIYRSVETKTPLRSDKGFGDEVRQCGTCAAKIEQYDREYRSFWRGK